MPETLKNRLARRDFLKAVGAGTLGTSLVALLGACAPAAAPAPAATTAAPKATDAPKAAASAAPAATAAATQAPAKTGAKVTLNMWQIWSGKNEEALKAQVGDFNASQNEIEMKLTTVPLADVWPKILAAIAAGSPPDTYTSSAMVRPELINDKAIEDLNKYGKRPDLLKAFDVPTTYKGGWYGVPMNGGLWTQCYNENLYKKVGLDPEKAPKSWDDLVEHGKKLTVPADNQFGLVLPNKPIPWTCEIWYGFLLQAGGEFLTADNSAAAFNSEAGVKALQFYSDLHNVHKVASLSAMDNNGVQTAYNTGKVGMWTMYPVNSTAVAGLGFKSRNVPAVKGVQLGTHFAGTYMPMMSGGKNKEALWKFFDWWMQPENNAKWCVKTGGLPIRSSVPETQTYKDFLKAMPLQQAYIDSTSFAKPLPLVLGISEMEQAVAEAVEACVIGKAPVKATLDTAATKVNDVIKKYKA
ncbi:MAG: ABC transporter substrate-binding protein [Chloroflexota bacterium]